MNKPSALPQLGPGDRMERELRAMFLPDAETPIDAPGLKLPATEPDTTALDREEQRAIIGAALDGLPLRERAILALLHGLDGARPLGLRAVAAVLGVSHQRVGQVSQRAEARLREAVRAALAPRGRR